MNKYVNTILSIVLSYIFIILFSTPITAIFASIPLYILKPKRAFVAGLIIGFFVPVTIYAIYPLNLTVKLASILSPIVGMPGIVILFLYPLIYGILMALSASLWSGIYERSVKQFK